MPNGLTPGRRLTATAGLPVHWASALAPGGSSAQVGADVMLRNLGAGVWRHAPLTVAQVVRR